MPFLDLDTEKITFGKQMKNRYNGLMIPIFYTGRSLYVKYNKATTPFGINEVLDFQKNPTGRRAIQINCDSRTEEKAKELDQFFIENLYENKWNLSANIPKKNIEGYDEWGLNGVWKRIVKKPYKNVHGVREYLHYPLRMDLSIDPNEISIFNEGFMKV